MQREVIAFLICLIVTVVGATAGGAQSGVTSTVLAEAQVPGLPAPPVNVRVSEGTFAPGDPAITHSHAMGWVYVVQGFHILVVGGRTETFRPGQAAWTPAGVTHTHDWDRRQVHKFWFIGMATNQPATLPPGFRLFRLTDPLEGLLDGPYTVRLSQVTVRPGAQTAVVKVVSPELLIGVSGSQSVLTEKGHQTLGPEQVLLLQAGSAYLVRNASAQSAVMLVQSLIPRE